MYLTDQRRCATWLHEDPSTRFKRLVLMCVLSIQQPWSTVGYQLADVDKRGGKSRYLWGNKGTTWDWLEANPEELMKVYRDIKRAVRAHRIDQAHLAVARIPGIGLAKGGFILQLGWGVSGCLDSVNVARLGLARKDVSLRKTEDPVKQTAAIRRYLGLVEQFGGTAVLWDEWCNVMYSQDASFSSPTDVSARHWRYLQGDLGDTVDLPL
jgi:hypothetical protein